MLQTLDKQLINIYTNIKSQKDSVFQKIFKPLGILGIPADAVSFWGLFLGTISVFFIENSHRNFIIFWIGYRLTDTIDGSIAKLNNKKILKNVNVDFLCDNIYSILLFCAAIPIVGFKLPFFTIVTYLLHIISNQSLKGTSFFVPRSDYAQFFYIIRKYELGLIIQTILTIIFLPLGRIVYKKEL